MSKIINITNISSVFQESPEQQSETDEYKRSGNDSGLVIIFNQLTFEDETYKFRKGTNKDVNELVLTFGRLGFNIEEKYIFHNLTRGEILDTLSNLSQEDHSHRNCLIIIVLTHGEENNVLQARDAPIFAYEIWEPFFSSSCATLKDKPKFFIFQACKGDSFSTSTDNAGVIVPEAIFKNPLDSDILIAFSSVEGGKSCRNPKKGTWFIQELCRNFSTFGRRDDVVSVLLRVSKCIAHNYYHILEDETNSDKIIIKQMPTLISTLSKKFYLSRSKDRKMLLYYKQQQELMINAIDNMCDSN